MTARIALLLMLGIFAVVVAQEVSTNRGLLVRRYREGERLTYRMKATNDSGSYEIQAAGVVKRDAAGEYLEEYAWSKLRSDGAAVTLPPASLQFRQVLSLAPDRPPVVPDLRRVHPTLIGPMTDLLTFYADLWLAMRDGQLTQAGDRRYRKHGTPASWADGTYVVLGEDSIDFDITLTRVDQSTGVARLLVRHVPPDQPQVRLPATWMRDPLADALNNWVQVTTKDGTFVAAVGKETFDVRMAVSLADGKILSGTIENAVNAQERDCRDATLTSCGGPRPRHIFRKIEMSLDR